MFDMLGRAKWDAWARQRGLSSQDAKQLYIESMLNVCIPNLMLSMVR